MGEARHILVVDDEKSNRLLFKEALVNASYGVLLAGNGKEAIDRVERYRIDLVILSMELLEKPPPRRKKLYALAIREKVRDIGRDYEWEGTVVGFLRKPPRRNAVIRKVREAFER